MERDHVEQFHIQLGRGTLLTESKCSICFDLVKRVSVELTAADHEVVTAVQQAKNDDQRRPYWEEFNERFARLKEQEGVRGLELGRR